ncbi:NADH-quinone oxidoreductase subunit N, partial [bacterium]|nr:NADH-quinone oxidoreductase subunit N [bacterium]
MSAVDWKLGLVAPAIVLVLAALLVLLVELPRRRAGRGEGWLAEAICGLGLLVAAALVWQRWGAPGATGFGGRFVQDAFATYFDLLFLGIGAATLLMALPYLRREALPRLEFLALLLFAITGMLLMVGATELITFFLALELLSMALYVLAGYQRGQARSVEAAIKYFLLGAFASALLLMGMALHWGATGSLALHAAAPVGPGGAHSPLLASAGFWLILVGLAFKVSAVPFHFWTADVYEGSPAPVAALMATGTKAAAFAALLRLLGPGLAPPAAEWTPVLWWLAVLTMSVGSVMAIVQSNLKRMLAFSSVAHAGYLLVAVVTATPGATRALLFYLVAYTLMNLGAFAVLGLVGRKGEEYQSIYDYAGLARRQPWLALLMSVFLFALAGIPPTVGFTGT